MVGPIVYYWCLAMMAVEDGLIRGEGVGELEEKGEDWFLIEYEVTV